MIQFGFFGQGAGDGARELLPGAQKTFDPEHLLAEDSKGSSLALGLCLIQFFVASSFLPRNIYLTHCRSPAAVPNPLECLCIEVKPFDPLPRTIPCISERHKEPIEDLYFKFPTTADVF